MKLDDPRIEEVLEPDDVKRLREEVELLEAAGDALDQEKFRTGQVSPMFFGSAINNFGLPQFLSSFVEMMPLPAGRESDKGVIEPQDERFTAFVFKIQANMDRAHRDQIGRAHV